MATRCRIAPHSATRLSDSLRPQRFLVLLGQALAFQYPDHPEFEEEVRTTELGRVFGELRRAFHAADGRIELDSPLLL